MSRREFVSCASHLALAAACLTPRRRALWAQGTDGAVIVAQEPFGRLEAVGDGIWALISNPLNGDRTTLSNGGIIAGKSGVMAIEGFNTPAGAAWLAGQARTLTGRWPTHVVVTHYHADHSNGVAGYRAGEGQPQLMVTGPTRDQVLTRNAPADDARTQALRGAAHISTGQSASIDLGERTVRLVPRRGHTSSDVSVEVDDPSVVFCGDLVWNGMFPNYVDTDPLALSAAVRELRRSRETRYVPGHGALAGEREVAGYAAMLDEVEAAARRARAQGMTAGEAAADFRLSTSLGEWQLFNPAFHERAFSAWYRVLTP
ncbi:MAG: MBL fold metallo-hydrolase [Gemmatimonadaceae bacterium]